MFGSFVLALLDYIDKHWHK
ncbi:hypothetical protein [Limosilactobacillus fermentum]|nr:hypothetical protein [Limosilactobacillus fermentum]MDK7336046.1 hypothetical protein [Limosilactobacillus fermentum]MDU3491449.1 hypothetical protein [Limosilactobacillus fermentum]